MFKTLAIAASAATFLVTAGCANLAEPPAKAPAMLALADRKVVDEAARIEAIARGDTASRWLPAALRAAGVLKEGETL